MKACVCGHACEPDHNLPESVFSFHHSGRGIKLKSPGSVVSAFCPLDNLKFGFSCFILCKIIQLCWVPVYNLQVENFYHTVQLEILSSLECNHHTLCRHFKWQFLSDYILVRHSLSVKRPIGPCGGCARGRGRRISDFTARRKTKQRLFGSIWK